MAATPSTLLAQTWSTAAGLTATVTDDGGAGRSATILSASTAYVRPYLANTSGTGASASDPYEFFARSAAQLTTGAGGGTWAVALNSDGRTKITWTGVGNGSIAAGNFLQLLGFGSGTGTGTLASGSSAYSAYPAIGLMTLAYRTEDTDWRREQRVALSEDDSGRVYGVQSPAIRIYRSFVASFAPRTWAEQSSGEYMSPAYPLEDASNDALYAAATAIAPGSLAPWTWTQFLASAGGTVCGFTDRAQELIATSVNLIHEVYLRPDVYSGDEVGPFAGESRLKSRKNITLQISRDPSGIKART